MDATEAPQRFDAQGWLKRLATKPSAATVSPPKTAPKPYRMPGPTYGEIGLRFGAPAGAIAALAVFIMCCVNAGWIGFIFGAIPAAIAYRFTQAMFFFAWPLMCALFVIAAVALVNMAEPSPVQPQPTPLVAVAASAAAPASTQADLGPFADLPEASSAPAQSVAASSYPNTPAAPTAPDASGTP